MAQNKPKPLSKKQTTILRNLAYYGWEGVAMAAPAINDDTHILMGRGFVDAFHNKYGFMRYRITGAGRAALKERTPSQDTK